jgi:exopolysaccharide biosynthesis polyprenyl glycosylphosphotransferase
VKRSEVIFGILRVASDALAVFCAVLLAFYLRTRNIDLIPGAQILEPSDTLPAISDFTKHFVVQSVILFLIISAMLKLYLIRVTLSAFREASRILLSAIVWIALIIGWYFLVQKQLFYSRAILIHSLFFVIILVTTGRIFLTLFQRTLLKKGIGVRSIISVGSQSLPDVVEKFLKKDRRYIHIGHIQSFDFENADIENVDLIIQTDPSTSQETNMLIDYCRSKHIGYAFLPPVLTDVPHLLSVYRFGSVPILRFCPTPLDGWGAIFKRLFDFILALILIILLLPLFLVIGIIIKIDSRGPVFYISKRVGQKRVGLKALPCIGVCKFRSMTKNADDIKQNLYDQSHRSDGPLFKIKNDPRITRIGKLLRRFSIDELPQIFNVLKGDLSLVGPRPHLLEEVSSYTDFQHRVFAVKPGITGLAQISGRSNLPFEEEVRFDLQYIEEWSPWLDLFILWRTIGVVLKGDGAD